MSARLRGRAWLVVLALVAGCAMPSDPCPMPPEQHPEAWTARPVYDQNGALFGTAYICTSQ